jgi:hypothetical protein
VTVHGYPMGGDTISITEGIVSRIEYQTYLHSNESFLAIQIDAAINLGNSGGPAFNDSGEVIGIAMQTYLGNKTNSIGYIVPSILVQSFLTDIKDNKVDGFHKDFNSIREIKNDSTKEYYGLGNGEGLLVTAIEQAEFILNEEDVILEVDNHPISDDGSIHTKLGRVSFMLALHKKQIGEVVTFKVLRNKEVIDLDFPMRVSHAVVEQEFNSRPRYFIFAGLVFTPLTFNYLKSLEFKNNEIHKYLLSLRVGNAHEKVVWMPTIFPHDINQGLKSNGYIVSRINGEEVNSFAELRNLIEHCEDEFIVIDFEEHRKIIINRKKAMMTLDQITDKFNIYADSRLLKR